MNDLEKEEFEYRTKGTLTTQMKNNRQKTLYDEVQERDKVLIEALRELAIVLKRTGELLEIITKPTIDYTKTFKFRI